jgi:hypothetical protein
MFLSHSAVVLTRKTIFSPRDTDVKRIKRHAAGRRVYTNSNPARLRRKKLRAGKNHGTRLRLGWLSFL